MYFEAGTGNFIFSRSVKREKFSNFFIFLIKHAIDNGSNVEYNPAVSSTMCRKSVRARFMVTCIGLSFLWALIFVSIPRQLSNFATFVS